MLPTSPVSDKAWGCGVCVWFGLVGMVVKGKTGQGRNRGHVVPKACEHLMKLSVSSIMKWSWIFTIFTIFFLSLLLLLLRLLSQQAPPFRWLGQHACSVGQVKPRGMKTKWNTKMSVVFAASLIWILAARLEGVNQSKTGKVCVTKIGLLRCKMIHLYVWVSECVLYLTGTSSDWCSRLQGGLMGRGLVANQYASTAVRAPMPTSVEVGRERKNCPSSSISGILRPLIISWACIFSIRVELNSAGETTLFKSWFLKYRCFFFSILWKDKIGILTWHAGKNVLCASEIHFFSTVYMHVCM